MIQTTIEQQVSQIKPQQISPQPTSQKINTLNQAQITSIYKLTRNQQTIPQNVDNIKDKLQHIFEYICQNRANVLPIFVIHIADYIRKGQIILRDVKYARWFQSLVFGRIRQPLDQQKQYTQYQPIDKQQIVVCHQQNSHQAVQLLNMTANKDDTYSPVADQLLKQQYNSTVIEKHIRKILTTAQKQQNQLLNLWKLPQTISSKDIINNQYYIHLVNIVSSLPLISTEFYSQVWQEKQSRQYILKYISYVSNIRYQCMATHLDALYALFWRLQQSNRWGTKQNQWQIASHLCLQSNPKYQNFKINQVLSITTTNQCPTKLTQLINNLTPSQLYHLHSLKQYTALHEQISKQTTTANIQYLSYLLDPLLIDNNKQYTSRYISSQIERISQELINNSYPTTDIVINSYCAITNICYQIQRHANNYSNQQQSEWTGKWTKMISKLAVSVMKYVLDLLVAGQADQQLAIIACRQRIQLISEYLPAQYTAVQDSQSKLTQQQTSTILKILTIGNIKISKPKLQQLSNNNNPYICILMGEYLAKIQYNTDYTDIANHIVTCLLTVFTQTQLLGVADKYIPVLCALAGKYVSLWDRVVVIVMTMLDYVEKSQKMLPYLCNNDVKHKQLPLIIFHSGTTVADIALSVSLSNYPQISNIPCSAAPIISQLIQTKSTILHKCQTLLTTPPSQSLTPYLLQIHNPNLNSPTLTINNLHQYNNTSIKYHEIIQHNANNKQPIFDSDFYRNHANMYLYLQCLKLAVESRLRCGDGVVVGEICGYIVESLRYIRKIQGRIVHNSAQFYSVLNIWKFIYAMVYYQQIIEWLTLKYKQDCILQQLLNIAEAGSIHPLVRQHVSLIIGKLYHGLTVLKAYKIREEWRTLLMSKVNSNNQNININVFVPVIFTLGYEMIENTIVGQQKNDEIQEIFQILIRYISCHHAYIRSIVQYYIKAKTDIQTSRNKKQNNMQQKAKQGSFLENLCNNLWKNDKDCIKILRNIGIAVEGFRDAMNEQESLQFLGYERIEQYPSQVVIRQLRHDLVTVLTRFLNQNQINLKKARLNQQIGSEHKYLAIATENMSKKLQKINKFNQKYESPRVPLVIYYKLPDIIIIATLLEKVHNFGYILRTLHEQRAMLLVPSKQPLEHPECKQFIPKNSQVDIIQIKQNQLGKFIQMNKKLGYPLIGLQQCAGSVKIQQYKFPAKYMLLLGNQRIGAPASLLNLADVLVEIPQVGKVRSLNVHVSMAICLWQSIINQEKVNE